VSWLCRTCEGENPDGTRFCGHCGAVRGSDGSSVAAVDEVIERLSRGQVPGEAATAQRHGQRRLVTALFADVSGFTALADDLDPETVSDIITAIVAELSEVVGRYDGYVDKYAGDALLAFFGAPLSHEDDAERALACALEMQEGFAAIQPTLGDEAAALGLHIGVNTGHAIALVIGSEVRTDYSVLGDAINVAQRLEAQAPTGEIYVGALTERLARRSFVLEPIGNLDLKGKAEPVPAWRLAGRRDVHQESPAVVGRVAERRVFTRALDSLDAGNGEVVIVSGYAGVGKTSLIAATRDDARARGVRWLDIHGVSYRTGTPYEPIVNLVSTLVDDITVHAPALFGLLDPGLATAADDIDPEGRRTRLHDAFVNLVRALAREPLVLAVEDIHWADDATAELLAHVAAQAGDIPVLLIVSARTDSDAMERFRRAVIDATAMTLEGLGDDDMRALIEQLAPGLVPATVASIRARARGNPFFAVELVRAVTRGETPDHPDDLPPTIESALASRLDRLGSDARRLLDLATTIGAEIPMSLLTAAAPEVDVSNVTVAVKELVESELLEPVLDQPDTLQFRHTLVQEVAYARMLRRRARALHLRVADEIERAEGSDGDAGDLLADHLYRADAGARAVHQLLRSATRAEDLFANDTAILHLTRAHDLLLRAEPPDDEALIEVRLRLGAVYTQVGAYPEAGAVYEALLDGPAAIRARCGLAATLRNRGEYAAALDVLAAADPSSSEERALLALERGRCLMVADSFHAAIAAFHEGLDTAATDDAHRATLLHELARAESSVGLLDDALGHSLEAQEAFEATGDLRHLVSARRVLGGVYEDLGRLDDAATVLRDALAMAEHIGHVEEAAGCLVNLALVELARGDADAAIEYNRRAIEELDRIGHPASAGAHANLAEALLARGDLDEVDVLCERAIALAEKHGDMLTVADARLTSALADLRLGRPERAAAAAELAAARFADVGSLEWAVKAYGVAAEGHDARGDLARAGECRAEAARLSGTSDRPPRAGSDRDP
jgi:class 3 adenylate cyclase/tetratricopeptide (TPR) repeat protein